jgi:hypothetical protein
VTGAAAGDNWAILRQLAAATRDALGDGAGAAELLRLPDGFADPALLDVGLHDYVTPVGPQKFLEVVGPVDQSSYIHRWLDRVGGSGGYCLSVQVPDLASCRARALAAGVRLAADQTYLGYPLIQMHPGDVGILLELDGIPDPSAWYWDDVAPGPADDAVINDIVGVRIAATDPAATAAQWADIIGLELTTPTTLDFSGCVVEFVAGTVNQLVGVDFQLASGADAPVSETLLGLQVTYRTPATVDV